MSVVVIARHRAVDMTLTPQRCTVTCSCGAVLSRRWRSVLERLFALHMREGVTT